MIDPRRLRDDPAFRELTQGALDDEPLALGPYDVSGLRDKVLRGEVPPPPPATGPSWTTLVGISGLTAALVSAALWAFVPMTSVVPPLRPTPAPSDLHVGEPLRPERAVVSEVGPPPQVAVPPVQEAPSPAPVQVLPTPDLPAPAAPPAPIVAPAPEPIAPVKVLEVPPPRGGLQAELTDYNRALDAAEASRWAEARERYAAYLESWPDGRLRSEAQLGLLSALVRSERPEEAEALARQMLQSPAMVGRRTEIRLLEAEALVELQRCDEALAIVGDMRRSSRTVAIRSECRRQRR